MKKTLLLSCMMLSFAFSQAQILSEGFESATFPPTGWTTSNTNASRPWGLTTVIFNATGQATFNITGQSAAIGWIAADNDAELVSPTFSLVGYSAANFSFKTKVGYEYMVSPFPSGDLIAQISTNNGVSWTSLWVEEDYGVFVDYATLDISLDLSTYLGQSGLKVRFFYTGNDADSVSVDDVLISGTLSSDDFSLSSISLYPNPTTSVLNISNNNNLDIKNISVVDVNGRTVKNQAGSLTQINVSDLNAGVYFVTIEAAEGKTTKKFIKQ